MSWDSWFSSTGKFAADMLGLGPDSRQKGLSEAAFKLVETLDQTVQNTYVENGWADAEKTYPNGRNITTQTPELIILIKKRMFSSLKENFILENMDDTEKSFILACKKLFENKCKEISAYEKLTKAEQVIKKGGLNFGLVASVLDSIDQAQSIMSWGGLFSASPEMTGFQKAASKIREVLLLNEANTTTTWVENSKMANNAGTGVIELTLVSSFNSTTSVKFGGGSASFSILDPYRLFAITEQDIERAIYETSDSKFNLLNNLADTLQEQYNEAFSLLNAIREARGASTVTVNTNPYNANYNRIVIILDRYGIELTSADGNGLRDDVFNVSTEEAINNFEGLINVVSSGSGAERLAVPNAQSIAQVEMFQNNGRPRSINISSFALREFDEEVLLKDIFEKATLISSLRQKDYADFIDYGQRTNYNRRTMRQNFLGKQLIQPMDTVTAFISSQTIDDNAALAGLRSMFSISDSTANFSSNLGNAVSSVLGATGIPSAVGTVLGPVDDLVVGGLEKIANSDFGQYTQDQVNSARLYLQQQQLDVINLSRNRGGTIVGALNKNIGDLKELWGSIFGTDRKDYALEAEKNMLAGPDFPMYWYQCLRSYFGATDFGACVFNGVVSDASEAGQPGNNVVSVTCKDNCFYFEQGLYQDKPAVNQFNGHLYNPLTPFDAEFDEATGKLNFESNFKLLDENLSLINSGVLKYKFGRLVNQNVSNQNIFQPEIEELKGIADSSNQANYSYQTPKDKISVSQDIARKIFYNPDGFVYRWKKGIGTAWIDASGRNLVGSVLSEEMQDNRVANIIRSDPFSGQDLVNIISLLVTGEPYNLSTFLNASIESGILRVTPGETVNDYITALSRQIRRQNQVWGNFVPFKRFTVSPSFFNQLFTAQITLKSQSKKLEELETEKAKLMQDLMRLDSTFQNMTNLANLQGFNISGNNNRTIVYANDASLGLIRKIIELDNQVKEAQEKIGSSFLGVSDASDQENPIRIFADDVFTSLTGEMSTLSKESKGAYKEAFNRLKRKQNFITQRKLWQVKANNDANLFIVADEYDHDVDIQAIVQSLGDLNLINSKGFNTVGSKISEVTRMIGMEIYANTQGHIELRIPQYNKVPSSLFFKMAERKRKFGIQYYPTFLEKTFQNRLDNVYNEIEIIEDDLRLYTTVLGYDNDIKRQSFLSGSNNPKNQNEFTFLTEQSHGSLLTLRNLTAQITTDFTDDYESERSIGFTTTSKGDFFERNLDSDFINGRFNYFSQDLTSKGVENADVIAAALDPQKVTTQVEKLQKIVFKTTNNFDPIKQIENLNEIYSKNLTLASTEEYPIRNVLSQILNRQERRTGTKRKVSDFVKNTLQNSKNLISPVDILNIEKNISKLISQRYRAILSASSLIKNLDQAARANSSDNNVLAGIMLPNLMKDGDVPDFMAHMIEDETEDDYGYQSGKRYIIRQQDILSSTYKEQAPEFTTIKVQGAEAGGLIGGKGFDLGSGMEIKSVWAADYDLWRMYGFKDGPERFMPFLSNTETQLAPYAIFLLNQQRATILHASVTRVGNEFIQPGEVYYLEDRDLLFYCEQVSQSFSYGTPGSFQTTMSLTYGHTLGEYIPTPLDVIGKSIYRGHYTNIGSYRLSNPVGATINPGVEIPIGAIIWVPKSDILGSTQDVAEELLFKSDFSEQNSKTLKDIQYKIKNIMSSSLGNITSDKYAVVSLRIFNKKGKYNEDLQRVAQFVSKYLQNPSSYEEQEPLMMLDKNRIVGGINDSENLPDTFRLVDITSSPNSISNSTFPAVRNPSSQAIEQAKRVAASQRGFFQDLFSSDTDEQTDVKAGQLQKALINSIVDIWVEFINPNTSGIQTKMPFSSDNMNDKQKSTTKGEIDLNGVDDFYNNIKQTQKGYEANVQGFVQTIELKYSENNTATEEAEEDVDLGY